MNDMIDTSSDLRDLISVEFQELYVPYNELDEAVQEEMDREADLRTRYANDLTMDDILEG